MHEFDYVLDMLLEVLLQLLRLVLICLVLPLRGDLVLLAQLHCSRISIIIFALFHFLRLLRLLEGA